MGRTWPVLVLTVFLLACGDTDTEATSPATTPRSRLATETPCDRDNIDCLEELGESLAARQGFSGRRTEPFTLAYQVCSTFTIGEVAEQYDAPYDALSAASAYAYETFQSWAWGAAEKGCLAGFRGKR